MPKETNRNREWIEFSSKIVYIYENLFKKNREKLISYFSTSNLSLVERKRKIRTVENWLKGKIKKPNKFHLNHFRMSEYKMPDGTILLPHDAFEEWSFKKFSQRVDEYISLQKQSSTFQERIKYIYYFNIDNEELTYYEVFFPNSEQPTDINLYSSQLVENMLYRGDMIEYQSMLYITVKNEFDYMYYIFENFATVFSQEVRVFGTGQCKDYFTRKPKAYMALLTSSLLSIEEEGQYTHKLNRSNLLLAKPFSRHNKVAKEYLVENFTHKIDMLGKDLSCYKEESELYYQIAIQTFTAYDRIAKKLSHKEDYFIQNKKSVKELIMRSICQHKKEQVNILYALTISNIELLEIDSPDFSDIINQQIELIAKKKLALTYLFVVVDNSLINDKLITKILEMQKRDIEVKIVKNSEPYYAEAMILSTQNIVIYQNFNDTGNHLYISKHSKDKIDINWVYQSLLKQSSSIEEFLVSLCPLNGKWYSYSYGSKMDNENYHTVEIEIKNHTVVAKFPSDTYSGTIHKNGDYTLLLFKNTVVKVPNISLNDTIFRISIIGKELNIHYRDVLLFGLMSREKLSKENVSMLLDALYQKESENFRLKISDEFDSVLARVKKG